MIVKPNHLIYYPISIVELVYSVLANLYTNSHYIICSTYENVLQDWSEQHIVESTTINSMYIMLEEGCWTNVSYMVQQIVPVNPTALFVAVEKW